MRVVALSGSLRAGSSNALLLRATSARLGDLGVECVIYEGVGGLPHFNPDLDVEPAPPPVVELRALLRGAGGFAISCPEYAHGIPGAFKNALDWVVSSGEFSGKPVILLKASVGGGEHMHAALVEVLRTMDANVLVNASLLTPFTRRAFDAGGNLVDDGVAAELVRCLEALRGAM